MAFDEIGIGQIDRRWTNHPVNHFLRLTKEILVMRALSGAVGDDKCGLPATSRTSAPLRIVGGRRRHVAHVDDVHRRDVDAELHGRRAEERGQKTTVLAHFFQLIRLVLEGLPIVWTEAEASLANLAKLALDLRCMLPTLEAKEGCAAFGKQACDLLIQPTEIRIAAANLRITGPTVERDRGAD